jgi:hypothetical protein
MHARWLGLGALFALGGCGFGSEGNFTLGLSRERCDMTFPICQTTAGCTMGATRYIEGKFPGTREFIVNTPEDSIITVEIFFKTELATGVETRILWNEPGCFDTYEYESEGRDIFEEAGNDQIFSQSRQVYLPGDHLIEVTSDALAEYALRIKVEDAAGVE